MTRLKNRIAVVTGGSKGIGKSIAVALAKEGCDIALCGRSAEDLKKAEKEVARHGSRVLAMKADVQKTREVEKFARTVIDISPLLCPAFKHQICILR